MNNKFILLLVFAQSALLVTSNMLAIGNSVKQISAKKESLELTQSMRGNGMNFTPNKGQIADMNGKLCPDILYKGDGGSTDVYLRKTGISYIYTNMGEVMHEVDEQVEELIRAGIITEADEREKKDELLEKQNIKIHRVDMNFANCNTNITTAGEEELDGYNNYYYAHCPNGITNVKQYSKVIYKNIYNNIDVVYYGNKDPGIKYDLIIKPHADPNQIKLHWKYAESIRLNSEGNLVITTSINEFTETIPKVYQNINGKFVDIKARYKLDSRCEMSDPPAGQAGVREKNNSHISCLKSHINEVTFELGTYNPEFPLIIDPWATYYGGLGQDQGCGVAADASGNVYLAGYSNGSLAGIAWGGFQNVYGGSFTDAFLVKFNGVTGARLWATYYGGTGSDISTSVATDALGNVYMAGYTNSNAGIATATGFQNAYGGIGNNAFLVKFDGVGARLWATYYGVPGSTRGNSVATDASGNVYMAGETWSTAGIASGTGFQNIYGGGGSDAFLVKFNAAGVRLWATYYGGTGSDFGTDAATDGAGNVYMAGTTQSTVGIASGGFQNVYGGGGNDAFLVKFNGAGGAASRLWATYYGGTGSDAFGSASSQIATDLSGNIYMAGITNSTNGIAFGGFQNLYGGGGGNAFLVKFNGAGGAASRLWATYYGGTHPNIMWGANIATDNNNNIYLYFEEEDADGNTFPPHVLLADACAWQPTYGGLEDQMIIKFNSVGKKLCATYVGGAGEDDLDTGGEITVYGNLLYITGLTQGAYPVTIGAHQTTYGGGSGDAFLTQLCTNICEGKVMGLNFTTGSTTTCANTLVSFTPSVNNSCDTSGYKYQWTFTGGTPASSSAIKPGVIYSTPGTYPVKLVLTTLCKKDSLTKLSYVTVTNCGCVMSAVTSVIVNASCSGANDGSAKVTISAGSGGPYTYSWSNGIAGTTSATTIPFTGLSANTYTVTLTEGLCASVSTVAIASQNTLTINSITATNCDGGNNSSATVTISSSTGGPYTYNWSTGASSITGSLNNSITNLIPGSYTVTVTNGSCTAMSTIKFNQVPFALVVNSTEYSCITNTGTATAFPMNGTSPYTYAWSNGQSSAIATGLSLGTTYTVTATDANGCTAMHTAIPILIPMLIDTASQNIRCGVDGLAEVTVTSGIQPYTYRWSNGETAMSIKPAAGTYTVTVTDGKGCTVTKTFIITSTSPVSAAFTYSAACVGTQVNFTNTGTPPGTGIIYNWIISPITPANVSGTTTNFSYTFLTAGTYGIEHVVGDGTCANRVKTFITITNCNGPTVTSTGSSICPGTCATVTSNGIGGASPYTYLWSTGATTQNISPCPVSTTTYTIKITDSGGVTSTSTAVVTVNPAVSATTTSNNISCNGGTGSAAAAGTSGSSPFVYIWNNGQTTQTATGLGTGNYTVTITDAKSCTATATAGIISPPPFAGQFTKGTANCTGCGCKQWIMINSTGGTSPYFYSWPDGYDKRYRNKLCPGNYTINIKDKNGCNININLTAP